MEVVLLGTGAAAGWPNPFCTCASCGWARAAGVVRGQSSALVDDTLLIDCGPEVPRAAERLGHPLVGVRQLLLTHAHADHTGPMVLPWREWAGRTEPLDVVGPAAVIAECRKWTNSPTINWREVRAGDDIVVGAYSVRVVAANHPELTGPPVLYDVTAADGDRLFWGADTGPLTDATLTAMAGAAYDAVFLEETFGDGDGGPHGHLDLATFPQVVAQLRANGAVTDRTRLVAIHLGCDNPPGPELERRLAAWGAEALQDGAVVDVAGGPARSPARPLPPYRVLVLGGARSGKSAEAECRLAAEPAVTYVATARARPDDGDWAARVAAHVARRPAHWRTVETTDLTTVLMNSTGQLLIDCLTLWLSAMLDDGRDVGAAVDELVAAWRSTSSYADRREQRGGLGCASHERPRAIVPRRTRRPQRAHRGRLRRECGS